MPDLKKSNLKLATSFPNVSQADWMTLVEKGLRGADFEKLHKTTDDGLVRGLLCTETDLPENIAPLPRAGAPLLDDRPWHITAQVSDSDIAYANQQALEDLTGAASALRLSLCPHGVTIKNKNEMKRLLDQVYTNLVPIIVGPNKNISHAELFTDFKDAHICLGLDPAAEGLTELVPTLPPTWRAVTINAASIHDKGGTQAQELAIMAAGAVQAFRTLGKEAARHIGVEITTDQDVHLSIAKLRAARRIYARIAQEFGVDDAPLNLHVVTSTRMMQSVAPWTNMLRVMSAGFGAVIGGADFITTRAFTHTLGTPTAFGNRIARNMQLLMMEESHLGQVQDAAFGSYFHERMSEQLAQTAWAEFQAIEADGYEAFDARIEKAAKAREDKAEPILGVTLHPTNKTREAKVRRAYS